MSTDAAQYSAPIGPTAWRLTAIGTGSATCDHCGRTLKYTYRVINPAGADQTLGRACVKKATGWNLAQAEAARILNLEIEHASNRARWATYTKANPVDAAMVNADIVAWIADHTARSGRAAWDETTAWNGAASGAGPAAELRTWIAQGRDPGRLVTDYRRRRTGFSWAS